jgi:hypothetical protein
MKRLTLKIGALNLFLMCILFSCGDNSDKITLLYNFKQGDILKQNIVMSVDLVQKFMEQEMKVGIVMNMKSTFEVKEVRDDNYTVEVKYKELKLDAGLPGMDTKIPFDSNTSEDVATMTNFGTIFKAIIDKPFEVVMSKTGKVESVKGLESFADAMMNAFGDNVPEEMRQQITEQFGSQFLEESFKSQFEQNTGYFPDKPVGTGDSWNVEMETKVSNFAVKLNTTSTLKSIDGNIVNLSIDGTISIPEGSEQTMNGVKVKIALKGSQKGTLKINKDTGWIIFSDMMINFTGEVETMGMKVPVYVASKITVSDE